MTDQKLDPDSAEAFLRDLEFHDNQLPIQEAHIKATAKVMDQKMINGTQLRVEYIREHVKQNPEQGTASATPAVSNERRTDVKGLTALGRLARSNGEDIPDGVHVRPVKK